LISKFSIDIAERNGVALRRWLASDDRFNDRATAVALRSLKTPACKSMASLLAMTFADQRPAAAVFDPPAVDLRGEAARLVRRDLDVAGDFLVRCAFFADRAFAFAAIGPPNRSSTRFQE
jgi:hypothetical protein